MNEYIYQLIYTLKFLGIIFMILSPFPLACIWDDYYNKINIKENIKNEDSF